MGIAIVTQPIFLYAEIESYLKNLGSERTKKTYPVQSMLKAGLKWHFLPMHLQRHGQIHQILLSP